ncbi:hypothetical protein [Mycobacterium sp. E2479]|uniref:hypothetical protein n=1 Tax=Mycobacterium sp. E2479 TaxID=1834134 RepID=UPI0012E9D8BC|nr:hypothetical protein [Mycobacterium sp. E2479]
MGGGIDIYNLSWTFGLQVLARGGDGCAVLLAYATLSKSVVEKTFHALLVEPYLPQHPTYEPVSDRFGRLDELLCEQDAARPDWRRRSECHYQSHPIPTAVAINSIVMSAWTRNGRRGKASFRECNSFACERSLIT